MIKAVLFDLDGIIIDSEMYYIKKDLVWMKEYNSNLKEEDLFKCVGVSYTKGVELMQELIDYKLSFEEVDSKIQEYIKKIPMNLKELLFQDAINLINYLKQNNYLVAVCSSSSEKEIKQVLEAGEVLNKIDLILTGHDFKNSKPAPDIYLEALKKLNIKNNEAIVIEDSYSGITAGVNANIYTIARRDTKFNINQTAANMVVDDLEFIKRYLEGLK